MQHNITIAEIMEFAEFISALKDKVTELERTSQTEDLSEKFLSSEETATYLGVSKRSLYNYRTQCNLPYHQIGRKILYNAKDVLEFANRFKVGIKSMEEM